MRVVSWRKTLSCVKKKITVDGGGRYTWCHSIGDCPKRDECTQSDIRKKLVETQGDVRFEARGFTGFASVTEIGENIADDQIVIGIQLGDTVTTKLFFFKI